jgi:hypothetical protein
MNENQVFLSILPTAFMKIIPCEHQRLQFNPGICRLKKYLHLRYQTLRVFFSFYDYI